MRTEEEQPTPTNKRIGQLAALLTDIVGAGKFDQIGFDEAFRLAKAKLAEQPSQNTFSPEQEAQLRARKE